MASDPRLEILETKCAYLEDALRELGDVVYRQQQELDLLMTRNQQLSKNVEALEQRLETDGPEYELPPHY